jgi:hypothetical protein
LRSASPDDWRVLATPTSVDPLDAAIAPVDIGGSFGGPSRHHVRARVETRVRDLGASLFDRLVSEVLAEDALSGHPSK